MVPNGSERALTSPIKNARKTCDSVIISSIENQNRPRNNTKNIAKGCSARFPRPKGFIRAGKLAFPLLFDSSTVEQQLSKPKTNSGWMYNTGCLEVHSIPTHLRLYEPSPLLGSWHFSCHSLVTEIRHISYQYAECVL